MFAGDRLNDEDVREAYESTPKNTDGEVVLVVVVPRVLLPRATTLLHQHPAAHAHCLSPLCPTISVSPGVRRDREATKVGQEKVRRAEEEEREKRSFSRFVRAYAHRRPKFRPGIRATTWCPL